jgi:hypothetical protein
MVQQTIQPPTDKKQGEPGIDGFHLLSCSVLS